MKKSQQDNEFDIEYIFAPKRYPHAPGSNKLTIRLHEYKKDSIFHPNELILSVLADKGKVNSLTISHPWLFLKKYRVFPGQIIFYDLEGNELEAYSFGATLTIDSQEKVTECIISSSAPIIGEREYTLETTLLVEEVQVLLAKWRANHLTDLEEFEKNLATIEPSLLYASCLLSLEDKYNNINYKDDPQIINFMNYVQDEIKALKAEKLWPEKASTLDKLL